MLGRRDARSRLMRQQHAAIDLPEHIPCHIPKQPLPQAVMAVDAGNDEAGLLLKHGDAKSRGSAFRGR